MPRKHLIILALFSIIVTGLLGWFIAPKVVSPNNVLRTSGNALVGGPFELIDHRGETVTQEALNGNFTLMVFGYTFCPDVCPTELSTVTAAFDGYASEFGDLPEEIKAYFVTIDPERDTQEQMALYMSNFHPRMVGLTGTPEQIKKAAGAYRIYYAKVKDEGSAAEYLMDHSALIFLMGPDGEYLTHFSYGTPPEAITASLKKYLG